MSTVKRYDHSLIIGDTYQPATVTVTQADGTAYDLTDATGEAKVRVEAGGEVLLTPTVTITDAAAGEFTWSATAAETAALSPGKPRYAVRITFADGTVRTLVEGTVTIKPGLI